MEDKDLDIFDYVKSGMPRRQIDLVLRTPGVGNHQQNLYVGILHKMIKMQDEIDELKTMIQSMKN